MRRVKTSPDRGLRVETKKMAKVDIVRDSLANDIIGGLLAVVLMIILV